MITKLVALMMAALASLSAPRTLPVSPSLSPARLLTPTLSPKESNHLPAYNVRSQKEIGLISERAISRSPALEPRDTTELLPLPTSSHPPIPLCPSYPPGRESDRPSFDRSINCMD